MDNCFVCKQPLKNGEAVTRSSEGRLHLTCMPLHLGGGTAPTATVRELQVRARNAGVTYSKGERNAVLSSVDNLRRSSAALAESTKQLMDDPPLDDDSAEVELAPCANCGKKTNLSENDLCGNCERAYQAEV